MVCHKKIGFSKKDIKITERHKKRIGKNMTIPTDSFQIKSKLLIISN